MANDLNIKVSTDNTPDEEKFKEWEIDDAVRTLIRAEEIKQDSELMAIIQPKLQKQISATNNVAKILFGNQNGQGKDSK